MTAPKVPYYGTRPIGVIRARSRNDWEVIVLSTGQRAAGTLPAYKSSKQAQRVAQELERYRDCMLAQGKKM